MPELDKKSPVCPNCLACGFPFWEQLTPEEQEFLCRTTRPVKYKGERVHSPVESCVGIRSSAPASCEPISSPRMAGT